MFLASSNKPTNPRRICKRWKLAAKHKFEKEGEYTIACKIQDDLAGETVLSKEIEMKNKNGK